MSFGYSEPSDIMVELINAAYSQEVLGVAAAGNDVVSYTDGTPGRIPNSFTVSASDRADSRVLFSNWGPRYLLGMGGKQHVNLLPAKRHEHGDATCSWAGGVSRSSAITQRIKDLALKGVIKDPRGSPNLLINNNSGA